MRAQTYTFSTSPNGGLGGDAEDGAQPAPRGRGFNGQSAGLKQTMAAGGLTQAAAATWREGSPEADLEMMEGGWG